MLAGKSVKECTEICQKMLDDLTSSKKSDCEKEAQACLDKKDCTSFRDCMLQNASSCNRCVP
jgi:hypothetical protein